jgi:hypothetical protein
MSCGEGVENDIIGNSYYYWKSSLTLSDDDKRVLKEQNIKNIYLHLFDVERNDVGELYPNTTLKFQDTIPNEITVIPTIFIAPNALSTNAGLDSLPSLILNRVKRMMSVNGYQNFEEIQIDFDWTQSNQERYFAMLDRLRHLLQKESIRLSTTIRLHQLSLPTPPVDYGVLMVYNTGDFRSYDEENSIISIETVKPYLKYLKSYKLPLATALPIYDWTLLFHNKEFEVIARGVDLGDTTKFVSVAPCRYRSLTYEAVGMSGFESESARIYPGDLLRHETSPYAVLSEVKAMIKNIRPNATNRIVLYHFDNKNLKKYTNEEIYNLFSDN